MSYDKQNWVTGEVITAEKLNHIEEGIDGLDIPVFNYTSDPVASADLHAFVMANQNKPFYINDDGSLMRTILFCWADPESNAAVVDVLSFDGASLHLYRYAPDGEYPEIVNRGDYVIWENQ